MISELTKVVTINDKNFNSKSVSANYGIWKYLIAVIRRLKDDYDVDC